MALSSDEIRKRVRELIRQAHGADVAANKAARAALEGAHKEILSQIARLPADASSYSRFQLQELKRAVERASEDFDRLLTGELKSAQESAFDRGKETVDRTLTDAIGAPPSIAGLSRTQLLVSQSYSADLVKGLSGAMRDRLNATLSRAFLGGKSVTEIMTEIGRSIGQGNFGIVSRRAETIYRTEVLRIQSIATQARLEQAVARGVDAKKMWVDAGTTAKPRPWHLAINRQVQPVNDPFEIPAGGPGGASEKLMFPRDPAASAENTVNCGCQEFPWLDSFEGISGLTTPA